MLTEEEAKTKWCPEVRTIGVELFGHERVMAAVNRAEDYQNRHDCRCIASACMAWRWGVHPPRETRRVYKGETHKNGNPIVRAGTLVVIDGQSWRYEYTDHDEKGEFDLVHRAYPESHPRTGYCGKAGAP